MQRNRPIPFIAAALALWAAAAHAEPPDLDGDVAHPPVLANLTPVTWVVVEARNHASGVTGPAAVVFGVALERGRSRPAGLRVDCVEGRTTVHVDVDGLGRGPAAVVVKQSLDGGRYVAGTWQADAEGKELALSGDPAIAFLIELYGRTELRLAVMRPLSAPFVLTFDVSGTEKALRPLAARYHWSGGPAISKAEP